MPITIITQSQKLFNFRLPACSLIKKIKKKTLIMAGEGYAEVLPPQSETLSPPRLRGKEFQHNSNSAISFEKAKLETTDKLDILLKNYQTQKKRLIDRQERLEKNGVRPRLAPRHVISHKDFLTVMGLKGPDTPEYSRDKLAILIMYIGPIKAGGLKNITLNNLIDLSKGKEFTYQAIKVKTGTPKNLLFSIAPVLLPFLEIMKPDFDNVFLKHEKDNFKDHFPNGPFGIDRTTLQNRLNNILKRGLPKTELKVSTHSVSMRQGTVEDLFSEL